MNKNSRAMKLGRGTKVKFLKTALSKGMDEARKTLPPKVIRYIHRGSRVYDESGNDLTGKEIAENNYPTITIHRKILNYETKQRR
jgi:hypothetical protein